MHTLDSPAWQWAMAGLCVAAAAWAGVRLMLPDRAFRNSPAGLVDAYLCRESLAAEVAMLAAMAAMFAYPAAPVTVWWAAFTGIGVALVVQLRRSCSGVRIAAAGYHLLAVAAMLYATLGHAGHSAHHGGPPMLGWVFATVFALDVLLLASVVAAAPGRLAVTRPRLVTAAVPHVVMDVAMIAMLYPVLAPVH